MGGDWRRVLATMMLPVSIHAPAMGGDPDRARFAPDRARFDPRPREGGDHARRGASVGDVAVSIHAPARGATHDVGVASLQALFRSTPPHGGRRREMRGITMRVSIHAPAWRATIARAWPRRAVFRSTPPHGGRRSVRLGLRLGCLVSIHAPAWRATAGRRPRSGAHRRFDPRPRDGGRRWELRDALRLPRFRSTPPRGGRHGSPSMDAARASFRSTPPRGGRPRIVVRPAACRVSIHAPARGATSSASATRSGRLCFDPRPREGGDAQRVTGT